MGITPQYDEVQYMWISEIGYRVKFDGRKPSLCQIAPDLGLDTEMAGCV